MNAIHRRVLAFCLAVFTVVLASVALQAEDKVQKTMTVQRCQATLKDGKQCSNQASDGAVYCWKHKGEKSVQSAADDVSTGANKAWTSTKTWSTNAWENTKSGANKAWTSTCDAFEEAGQEMGKGLRKVFDKDSNKAKK